MSYDPATTVPQYWSYDTNGSQLSSEVVNVINAVILADTRQINQTKIPPVIPHLWNVIMYAGEVLVLAERVTRKVIRAVSEVLTLTERSLYAGRPPGVKLKVTRQKTDTLTLAEALATIRKVPRTISDTLTLTESSITRLRKVPRSISDALTLTETTRQLKVIRKLTDALGLAETTIQKKIIRNIALTLALSEKIWAGRPPGVRLRVTRKETDTLTSAESIARMRGYFKGISDTLTLTETTKQLKTARRPSETLALTEAAVVKRRLTRIVSDVLTLAESVSSLKIPFVPLGITLKVTRKVTPEVLSLVDSIFSLRLRYLPPGVAVKVTRNLTTEAVHLAETSITRIRRPIRTISETLILSDGFGFSTGFEGFFTGLATGFEQFAGGVTVKVTRAITTEILNFAEGLGAYTSAFTTAYEQTGVIILKVIRHIGPEVLSLAEAISRIFIKGIPPGVVLKVIRPRTEVLHLAESVARKAARKAISDTLTLAETTISGIRRVPRTVSETLTLSETTPIRRKIARLITGPAEELHLTEFLDVIKNPTGILHSLFIHETIQFAEAAIKVKTVRPITEILHLVESIAKTRIVTRTASDLLRLTETAKQLAVIRQMTTETLTLTEIAISRTAKHFRTIPETLNLTESIFAFRGKVIAVFDTLHLTETAVTSTRIVPRIISESLSLAEGAAIRVKAVRKIITETLTLSESLFVYLNGVLIYSSAVLKEDVYRVMALFNKNIRRVRDLFFGQPGNTG